MSIESAKAQNLISETPEGSSLWRDAWIRLRANRLATISLFFFIFISILTIIGPEVISTSYEDQDLNNTFAKPGSTHFFGTDNLGRDLFARVLHGGRISLAVGFLATAVSLVIGVAYGMTSGYLGGKPDALMMRIVDILYSLPFTIFVILLMVLFGRNFVLLFIAIGAVEWLTMARITRGQTLGLKTSRIHRGCPCPWVFSLAYTFSSYSPQLDRTSYCLRHPYRTCRDATGSGT